MTCFSVGTTVMTQSETLDMAVTATKKLYSLHSSNCEAKKDSLRGITAKKNARIPG